MTPVNSIVVPVGASAYAEGSQVWKGISGTLTAKPRKAPAKIVRAKCGIDKLYQPSFTTNLDERGDSRTFSARVAKSNILVGDVAPGTSIIVRYSARKASNMAMLPTIV